MIRTPFKNSAVTVTALSMLLFGLLASTQNTSAQGTPFAFYYGNTPPPPPPTYPGDSLDNFTSSSPLWGTAVAGDASYFFSLSPGQSLTIGLPNSYNPNYNKVVTVVYDCGGYYYPVGPGPAQLQVGACPDGAPDGVGGTIFLPPGSVGPQYQFNVAGIAGWVENGFDVSFDPQPGWEEITLVNNNSSVILPGGVSFAIDSITQTCVPEPSAFVLLAAGVIGLLAVARRRTAKA
jgi:hypothetical protein